jgi:hypothetical protein
MPEKGLITVHIRGNSDTVTYVTGSRVNLEEVLPTYSMGRITRLRLPLSCITAD